jgi:hypothetical protein
MQLIPSGKAKSAISRRLRKVTLAEFFPLLEGENKMGMR